MLRLYDEAESARSHGTEGSNVLLVLDEAEPALVDATMAIVAEECAGGRRASTTRSSSAGSTTATT